MCTVCLILLLNCAPMDLDGVPYWIFIQLFTRLWCLHCIGFCGQLKPRFFVI